MVRVLWIVGLSISLVVFGGFPLAGFVVLIYHHHLTIKATINLLAFGLIAWMIVDYLILKIREPRKAQLPSSETSSRV
jgi:hypothetical protein